ncbi:uncharacterized protein LOC143460312 [Clavelina lepadiformis]|uniref:Uncharacterized protein n=1 Tax=Clavelina lepadiformis TaxID=159417 RepID=A0ABP0GE30_CLALP
MECECRPSELLFTQTTISSTFTNGTSIHDLIDKIKREREYDSGLLPLEVARDRYDGELYCNNNRRLYLFRVLEKEGYISKIRVKVVNSVRPKAAETGHRIRFRDGTPIRNY